MLQAYIEGRTRPLEVVDYSVNEQVNSLSPDDTSGGAQSFSVTVFASEDDRIVSQRLLSTVDRKITLYDTDGIEDTPFGGRGVVSGTISSVQQTGARITFSVDSILNRLNVDRVAAPFFGALRPSSITSYIINLSTNPSGEVGTTGYTVQAGTGGTAAITNPTVSAFAGTKVVRATWSVAATGPGGLTYTQSGFVAGNTYSFSTNVRADSGQNVQIALQWLTAGGANVGTVIPGTDGPVDSGGWVNLSLQGIVAPATATQAKLTIYNYNNTGLDNPYRNWAIGSTLDVDGWMINQGEILYPFADGSFAGSSWLGTAGASQSQIAVQIPQDPGYDATFSAAFRYYCGLVGIPNTAITFDSDFDNMRVSYPAWEGNVLDHLKMMCSSVGAEFAVVGETIEVRRPRQRFIRVENVDSVQRAVSTQGSTRRVEVTNYNNRWLTDAVTAKATSVYSLTPGDPLDFMLETTDSLTSVNNPVCVAAIGPVPYISGTGQYVITDSLNNVVNPASWRKSGGRIFAELNPENHNQVHVVVSVPSSIAGYTAPYRLATTSPSGSDTPALYITGTGVFIDVETVVKITGATASETTKEQDATVQNIFISNVTQANDRGYYAADRASGPNVTANGKISYDPDAHGQEFGKISGARFKTDSAIFRLNGVRISKAGIEFNDAQMDVTFDDLTDLFSLIFDEFDATYSGLTFAAFDALYPTLTFEQFDAQQAAPTFDTFDAIYAGATFNDHSVYPYLREATSDNTEARF